MKKVGISLGRSCLPAAWGVHWNYRDTKENGYTTCPFDMMITNYKGIVKCIAEDFVNYTNPSFLTYDREGIYNSYYDFVFTHEAPGHADLYITENWKGGINHFIDNNYEKLTERYDARINNIRKYLHGNNDITFILQLDDSNYDIDCKELKDVLLKYPTISYKIIIIEGPLPHDIYKTNLVRIIYP